MFDAATYNKSYQKDRRERLKASGRCFDCGAVLTEADGGRVRCAACNAVHRAKNRGGTVLSGREVGKNGTRRERR